MPKRQSRAARRAREEQRRSGTKYTTALRETSPRTSSAARSSVWSLNEVAECLAGELLTIGCADEATRMGEAVRHLQEYRELNAARRQAWQKREDAAAAGLPLGPADEALRSAEADLRAHYRDHPDVEAKACLLEGAYTALLMAPDATSKPQLLRAAANLLAHLTNRDCASAIRLGWLTDEWWNTTEIGPGRPPWETVARAARRTMVDAAHIRSDNWDADEADCEELLTEAARLAATAADLAS